MLICLSQHETKKNRKKNTEKSPQWRQQAKQRRRDKQSISVKIKRNKFTCDYQVANSPITNISNIKSAEMKINVDFSVLLSFSLSAFLPVSHTHIPDQLVGALA